MKRVDLNPTAARSMASIVERLRRDAAKAATVPHGLKVMGPYDDLIWSRVDGRDISVREVDETLEAAQGRIGDAEQSLADSQVRLDEAVTIIDTVSEDLTRVETEVIPGAVADLEAADQAAQEQFVQLDTRLNTFGDDPALGGMRQALTDAQATATSAQEAAAAADQAASAASQAALEAAGIAASKGRTIIQATEPQGEDRNAANIWIKPAVDDPDTDVKETATTYVYIADSDEWVPTTSDELAQVAQNALDAREAAQQAKQRAETAISNAATAQAAAEAAQRTANQATTDARDAHNEAVAAQGDATEALEKYGPLDQRTIDAQAKADAAQARADAAMAEASEAKGLAEDAVREVGDTVRNTVIEYAVNTSETVAPTSGWSTSTPTRTPGSFVWMRTIVTYADGDTSTTSPALLTGNAGAKGATGAKGDKGDPGARGKDGVAGKDGVGLSSTALAYALSTSGTVAPTSGWAPSPPTPIKGRYLWTRTIWTYTDSSTETGYSVAYLATDGAKGNDGVAGKDGVGIKSTTITYAASSSGTTAPSTGWGTQPPDASAGQYVWTKTVWTYTDNTTETGYSVGKIGNTGAKGAAGAKGDKGDTGGTGAQGVSVSSVTPFFRTVARTAGAPAQPSGMTPSGWVTTEPAWSSNTKLYRAERIVYSNDTVSWTVPTLVAAYEGIVQVQTSVNGKNSITRSTSNASGTGVAAGDAWYKVDANGDTMAMWIWSGSKWVASKVRNEMIDTVDVNKLKVHNSLEVIGDAVIEKLWADGIAAKSIAAQQVTVAPGNLVPDPGGRDETTRTAMGGPLWTWNAGGSYWTRGPSSTTVTFNAYVTPPGVSAYDLIPLTAGQHYLISYEVWTDVVASNTGGRSAIYNRKADGSPSYAGEGVDGGDAADRTLLTAGQWTKVERTWVAPNDTVSGAFQFQILNPAPSAAEYRIRNPRVSPKAGATLIEPGAITTEKLTVTGDMSAAIVNAMTTNTKKLVVTDEAILNHATLIGQTVVDDINIQGKLIGTDGVFTGTVDFENVNVTGTQIVNKLGANSISADKINGDTFEGNSFSGGTFVGSSFIGATYATTTRPRNDGGVMIDPVNGLRTWSTAGKLTVQIRPDNGQIMLSDYLKAVNSSGHGVMLIPTTSTGGGGLWFSHTGGGGGSDAAIYRSGYDPDGVEPLNIRGANGGHVALYGGLEVNSGGIVAISGASNFSDMIHTNPPTTSAGANALIASSPAGRFYRSTSSRRYKKNIVDWNPDKERVLALQPRQWQHDDPSQPEEIDETWHVGFVAEEVHDLGLGRLVKYMGDGKGGWIPDGLNYDRFAAAHQVVIKSHEDRIKKLEAVIERLLDNTQE